MGLDDAANCNTGLGLSLGSCHVDNPADTSSQADHDHQTKKMMKIGLKFDNLLPSLTLGPSDETTSTDLHPLQADQQASTNSPSGAVSSFSNSSSLIIKRDRSSDLGGEEVEVERVCEEYDQDQGSPRKKLRLTKQQSATLEDSFKEHATLNPKQKQELARKLNLRPRQVEVWFQNRRARTKLKQTEADCELLKKCCETLKEENRRLLKELQELQLMKQTAAAAPFYMQFPTATLSMCPSCETICNATTSSTGDHHHHHNMNHGSSTMSPFLIGSKSSHFFSPFTHPSTACLLSP